MPQGHLDAEAVLAANQGFYDAFGSLEMERLERVWEHSDRVMCVHPGWPVLIGWERVGESWESIFRNTTLMHFNITEARVIVQGDLACVSCLENITTVVDGRAANFAVRATNVFARSDNGWLMVHHHGSA